jgi:nucleotide-binding universal stress UspA family protein
MILDKRPSQNTNVLVVVDDTAECDRALHFAAKMAARIGAGVILLALPGELPFREWLGVGELIEDEEADRFRQALALASERVRKIAPVDVHEIVRFGPRSEQVAKLVKEERSISFLVLAASSGSEGPGPLVSTLVGKNAGAFPVPIVIVPEIMTDDGIDSLV